ncbi:MAG TPA: methyltransferase [Candidatus Acidoferrales bacterium]|jgi:SAM-dependent methyltransferase|nr:methyltransferase [Candidatus Acidoferrales bacterium]
MSPSSAGTSNASQNLTLVEMAMVYSRSCMVCAAARLGVADALAGGERSVDDLAKACAADRASLYRLLRALAIFGITSETTPGNFVLTALGEALRKDAPNSVWPAVVFWSDLLADSWSQLTDCVRTGQNAFKVMESKGIVPRWSKDPDANAIFRAVMGTAPAEDYMPIARAWDFTGRKVVADLGGGGGALISAILKNNAPLAGMLVDRQASIDSAAPRIQADGLADRCKLVAADLLENVPPGADVYTMKHVLHGYNDDVAAKLLRNCRAVIPPDGMLLVLEFVLPDVISQPDPQLAARLMSDLNMMAVTGGKERNPLEWKSLLAAGGFELRRIVPVVAKDQSPQNVAIVEGVSIIEAAPA